MALHFAQQFLRSSLNGNSRRAPVHRRQFFNLLDEPGIDLRQLADFLRRQSALHGRQQPVNPIRPRRRQFFTQQRIRRFRRGAPGGTWLQRANSLLQRLLEGSANGHDFTDGLHLRSESAVRAGKLFELPLGNFHYHVVDGRFEARGRFFRDVIWDFVQCHPHGQPRGDFRDGEAGRFAGQRRAARHARIHFDHHHPAIFRVHGELHVRTAGFDADFADNCGRSVAHALKFLVRQRLRGSHGNRIARVHAHGVEVFDGADHHEVVAEVAHHFELEFLPAKDGFFHQGFMHRTHVQRMADGLAELFLVISDRAAGSTQRKRWANHQRESQLIAKPQCVFRVVHQRGRGDFQTNFAAGILEPETVFRNFYGAQRRADHLHFIFFEDTAFGKLDRKIQRRLSSDRRQKCIRFFPRDNFPEVFLGQRLDVGAMRELRVGHDGRRIRIDQNDLVPLRAQRLARLRAGVIELASLADNDRPRPNNQNLLYVFPLRHILP